jgi:hypothetical protein
VEAAEVEGAGEEVGELASARSEATVMQGAIRDLTARLAEAEAARESERVRREKAEAERNAFAEEVGGGG